MKNPNAEYYIKTEHYDIPYSQYSNFEKSFGYFSEDGKSYTITDCKTPRPWLNYMVNDHFGSVVANDGSGFIFYGMVKLNLTKYYNDRDYLIRTPNGKREVIFTDLKTNESFNIFTDVDNLTCTVHSGKSIFNGSKNGLEFTLTIFVPNDDYCEIWKLTTSSNTPKDYMLTVSEEVLLSDENIEKTKEGILASVSPVVFGETHHSTVFFNLYGGECSTQNYDEIKETSGEKLTFTKLICKKKIHTYPTPHADVVIAGGLKSDEKPTIYHILDKYSSFLEVEKQENALDQKWDKLIENNSCILPDKNIQNFFNVWLKTQLYLTSRYNRADVTGYRDVMQDAWGNLLLEPTKARESIIEGLSKMFSDGRCPRQYDKLTGKLDDRDFMDSPIWACITLVDYIKESGDFGILDEQIGFIDTDKKDTLLNHTLIAFDLLYRLRGKNGLILMRRGDWLDGLSGINKYGEATTVWGTIATYYAQNLLAELLDYLGKDSFLLKQRSAEYKKVVNQVGWDGDWYAYAFIDDEPIGSRLCNEGKIYLNPQTWAIMSGIYDEEIKLEKMRLSIHTYLSTMYGPLLLSPAYTKYGEKCGMIQHHRPGTFSNGAIYLHGSAFKVFADCVSGNFNEAVDSLTRILPSNPDFSDSRRTSEPYVLGNVYYGYESECFGMNLYSWFTATPAWVLQAGYSQLLGVKAQFDGLKITPNNVYCWDNYSVKRRYRNTVYNITFIKGKDKGIYVDGVKTSENVLNKNGGVCEVKVVF